MVHLPDNSFKAEPESRHAAEWGLASLLMGGFLAMLTLVTLLFNILLGTAAPTIMGRSDVDMAVVGARVLAPIVMVLCITSACCGIGSLVSAFRRRQSVALGITGLLMSGFALLLWIVAVIDLFMILDFLQSTSRPHF